MSWQSRLMPMIIILEVVMMTVLLQDCWLRLLIVQQSTKSWLNTERVITYFDKTTTFLLTLTTQNVSPQPEEADVSLRSRESRSALFTIHLHQPCCSVSREQHSQQSIFPQKVFGKNKLVVRQHF